MSNNESDNESIFQREKSPKSIFYFLENQFSISMNYENDEKSNISEIENNNEYNSKDYTTSYTKEKSNNILGNKTKRYDKDENINDANEIKKNSNEFNEEKKNEDLNKDDPFLIILDKNNNEKPNYSSQDEEDIYKKTNKTKKTEKKFICKKSDSINQNNNQKVRFDGIVKKVKKLFFRYILKMLNEILEKKGILKKFRIPSHDFTKNVTIESNKFILTIDIKYLFCSTFDNKSQIGDALKKKLKIIKVSLRIILF